MHLKLLILLFLCNATFSNGRNQTCWKRPKNPGQKLTSYFRPFARIGRTINLNNDQLGPPMFSEEFLEANIIKQTTSSTETNFKVIQTDEDAKRMLDISGKLSLQLELGTAGSVAAQGAGSYLQNMGNRETYAELLLIAGTTVRFETLQQEEEALTLEKCKMLAKNGDTHLITGFEYGGQCIISIRVTVENDETKTKMEGELAGKLNLTKIEGKIKGRLTRTLLEVTKLQNVTIKAYCNANFEHVPTNVTEAMAVSRKSLNLLHDQKGGVPVKMELTPLTLYKKCRDVPKYRTATYNDIYLESCAAMMNDARAGLKRLQECVKNYNLNPKATEVKRLTMAALDDMRRVEYDMRINMREVNGASGIDKFDNFERIYDAGKGTWNYKYWTEYAIVLCNSMVTFAVPPKENTDLQFSPRPALGFWTESDVDTALNGLSPVMKTRVPGTSMKCYEVRPGRPLLVLIKEKNIQIQSLKLIIPKSSANYISLAKLFRSNDTAAFNDDDDAVHPSFHLMTKLEQHNTEAVASGYNNFLKIIVTIDPEEQSDIAVLKIVPRSNTIGYSLCSLKATTTRHKWMVA